MLNNIIYIYKSFPKSVWYLTLIQLLFTARTTILATRRTVGDYSTSYNNSTFLIILVISLALFVILKEPQYIKRANRTIGKLIFFYVLCLSSILWAGFHIAIIFKATEVLCNLYLMYIIASKIADIKLLLLYIIILSTITAYLEIIPDLPSFIHTNSYSMSAMIGFLLGVQAIKFDILKFKEIKLFLILNLIAIIGGTSSATYISFIAGLILIYSTNSKGINIWKFILILIITYIIYYVCTDIIYNFIFQGKNTTQISSGSGREQIFKACINAWDHSPIVGHGFIIGERSLEKFGLGINVLSAHNSFLAILVDTGSVGMFFFLNFLIPWIFNIIVKYKRNTYAIILAPATCASVINCLSYPAIGADWSYVGSLIFLMYIMTNLYIIKQSRYVYNKVYV